ncbi:hypothetical protein KSS94_01475 [Pseudomonas fakonensis]|uniref:Uncharacterized protein n=1 Tax=Pseudomonas fakonensis TaxID=2842355 RepID=A0ABX8N654_9PSED|nr:hypothetical protein [Pseudomonas fakonensis]QXH51846.1 hypothetical protein KSS94_01475 [Pseudomonas fakonensis]
MRRSPEFTEFVRRYFGVFIGTWFTSLVAVAWSFVLVWGTWFRAGSKDEMRATLVALLVVFMLGHGAVVRGRGWGAWIVAAMCVACVVLVIGTYGQRPHLFLFSASVAFALGTLLLLNSRRYREMQQVLAEHRQRRQAARCRR